MCSYTHHRDLKPENLLLDDDFRLKLTDFGTGKILSGGVERSKTWVGTAQYISPELLDSSETSKRFVLLMVSPTHLKNNTRLAPTYGR